MCLKFVNIVSRNSAVIKVNCAVINKYIAIMKSVILRIWIAIVKFLW